MCTLRACAYLRLVRLEAHRQEEPQGQRLLKLKFLPAVAAFREEHASICRCNSGIGSEMNLRLYLNAQSMRLSLFLCLSLSVSLAPFSNLCLGLCARGHTCSVLRVSGLWSQGTLLGRCNTLRGLRSRQLHVLGGDLLSRSYFALLCHLEATPFLL